MREPEPGTIARARAGDLRAFESLVRAYQVDVWRFAFHLTRDRGAAEDVTQEAFLRAFRALPSFRGEAKFTTWLLRIARNLAYDRFRAHRHETVMDLQEDRIRQAPVPPAGEDRVRIEEAIRSLPHDLREPFVTIEVLGYSYAEASTILGVKVGTLKSRMHRARAWLIGRLTDEEDAGEM